MSDATARSFQLDDLLIFDEAHLRRILEGCLRTMTPEQLAYEMDSASPQLVQRITNGLSCEQRARFFLAHSVNVGTPLARGSWDHGRRLLKQCFWELTYWRTPELYEELTVGEQLHPGIFQHLDALVRGKIVLDAGAGSGRASFECARHGARLVYALEPSPGLLRILKQKVLATPASERIIPGAGDFAHVPLASRSVDLALACSAFTSQPEQGGEPGLDELRRVVRPGGSIVLIWPRPEDRRWLAEHGFHSLILPGGERMSVRFPSLAAALLCARRFYANNSRLLRYLQKTEQPDVPFAVLGFNPPCEYCWLQVS